MKIEDKTLLKDLSKNTLAKALDLPYKYIEATHINQKVGAFVTLKERGNLRGCIGYIFGIKPLYQEIMDLTIEAAFEDYRFQEVKKEEFNNIEIEISILSEPKVIDNLSQFQLSRDGIILTRDYHRAVFLPQVADEMGWNREELFSALCKKAGLLSNAYKDNDIDYMTFQAEVF